MSVVDRETFIDFAALAIINRGGPKDPLEAYAEAEGLWNARQRFFGPALKDVMQERLVPRGAPEDAEVTALRVHLRQIRNIIEASHASSMRRDLDAIDAIVKGALA